MSDDRRLMLCQMSERSLMPATMDERRRLARNIAEVIDDLYGPNAACRDHARRIDLIAHQVEHAMNLAVEHHVEQRRQPS
jgi:hypothetical protein